MSIWCPKVVIIAHSLHFGTQNHDMCHGLIKTQSQPYQSFGILYIADGALVGNGHLYYSLTFAKVTNANIFKVAKSPCIVEPPISDGDPINNL